MVNAMNEMLRPMKPRFAAWVLLLAYICALPAALPLAFAAVACMDRSHGVELCAGGTEVRVILTHGVGHGALPHEAIHRHCAVARLLASFAQAPIGGDPDHIVRFAAASSILEEERGALLERSFAASDCAPVFVMIKEMTLPRFVDSTFLWEQFPTEHAPPAFLAGLKSTLLLI
jgi:hypothetical protein